MSIVKCFLTQCFQGVHRSNDLVPSYLHAFQEGGHLCHVIFPHPTKVFSEGRDGPLEIPRFHCHWRGRRQGSGGGGGRGVEGEEAGEKQCKKIMLP